MIWILFKTIVNKDFERVLNVLSQHDFAFAFMCIAIMSFEAFWVEWNITIMKAALNLS